MKLASRLGLDRPVAAVACILILVGCGQGAGAGLASATREPVEQSFGPSYPAQPPEGRTSRIRTAALSVDKQSLAVSFIGGPAYLSSDLCSADYEPWLAVRGETLDVTVIEVAREHLGSFAPNQGCRMFGVIHTYHLALPSPFTGTTVNDLAGGTFFVSPPPGLATASRLPSGWSLQRSFEQEPGPPPIWVQVYAATDIADDVPVEGRGQLVLYQAFGVIGEWSDTRAEKARERGAAPVGVSVKGEAQMLWRDPASGELLLGWTLDGTSLGLVGNTADITAGEFVWMAEGIAFPGP